MNDIDDLVKQIKLLPTTHKPILIAISGFGGSGKSTLAENLKRKLEDAKIISIDDFIVNRLQERSSDWSGFDRERFQEQVLKPAKDGKEIEYDEYNWKENKIIGVKTMSNLPKYLILEGCSLLHPDLFEYYDFSIWIDCSLEIATQRGMKRDRGWGVDHDDLWINLWQPNEKDFFDKYRPDKVASVCYNTNQT